MRNGCFVLLFFIFRPGLACVVSVALSPLQFSARREPFARHALAARPKPIGRQSFVHFWKSRPNHSVVRWDGRFSPCDLEERRAL